MSGSWGGDLPDAAVLPPVRVITLDTLRQRFRATALEEQPPYYWASGFATVDAQVFIDPSAAAGPAIIAARQGDGSVWLAEDAPPIPAHARRRFISRFGPRWRTQP